jgi:hypothetical protein
MNKEIIVLGGGSAGWLTAMFVKQVWPACNVTVIEDPATPPIVAGESGSASLNKLYNFLGIDMTKWIISVNAMPKLGGKFVDWDSKGTDFVHGLIPSWYNVHYNAQFPEYGENNDFIACALATGILTEDIFYNSKLQRNGKLPITPSSDGSLFNVLTLPMWHFDSRANAAFLKELGQSRSIQLLEGKYISSVKDINGDIVSVTVDATTIKTDWIFDCSGFARLILQKELEEPFVDYTDYFPAKAVMAWWDDAPVLKNHTEITAMGYGWCWNINLKHRAGNGYIYDPDLITFDQAILEAETRFNTKIEPVANLKFTPGILKHSWKNNAIAIGISSGFLEPLESNGLATVVEQLQALAEHWSPGNNSIISQRLYNKQYQDVMDGISDFLSLHYRGHRNDTAFWKEHNCDPARISHSLQEKLDMWQDGILGTDNTKVYAIENYAVVLQGLNLINTEKLKHRLLSKRSNIFEEFYQSYSILTRDVDNISNICYTMEQWDKIIYGSNQ